jgi:hypothetical protein
MNESEDIIEGDMEAFFAGIESCQALRQYLEEQMMAHERLAKRSPGTDREAQTPQPLASIDEELTTRENW